MHSRSLHVGSRPLARRTFGRTTVVAPVGIALTLLVGACGSASDEPLLIGDGVDPTAVELATNAAETSVASTASTTTTAPALTLPVPAGAGDANTAAAPADGSSSTVAETASTAAPSSAPPTTVAVTTQPAPTTQATAAPVANRFPDVSVTDLANGRTMSMRESLGGGDRPLLLWFWSPF